ncbi:MAG: hypothetical protein Ct9H300mP3_04910 [Gammaproteobacteria bacterium]|nr:MAG: hypothetical protein Ct9H300mP3_04910 [Gammaproteobacteria bacterium]
MFVAIVTMPDCPLELLFQLFSLIFALKLCGLYFCLSRLEITSELSKEAVPTAQDFLYSCILQIFFTTASNFFFSGLIN